MKTKHKLTSIAFVVAATLSMGALAASPQGRPHNPPVTPTPEQEPSASTASVQDAQVSLFNSVENDGTENNAAIDDTVQGGSGNAGINFAAGDSNQQANALAISTADADADFVFGNHRATASISVGQLSAGNSLSNLDVTNNATLENTGNGYSGNLGLNVAAGSFNQQKNDAAIANAAEAQNAEASIEVLQVAAAGDTYNGVEAGDSALSLVASGYGRHPGHGDGRPTQNQDVQNNASITGSLNGFSGSVGVNLAAGGSNQQSNTLAIAAGCSACPPASLPQ